MVTLNFEKPIYHQIVWHLNSLAEDLFVVDNILYPWESLFNCARVTFLIYCIFFLRLLSWVLVSNFIIVHVGCLQKIRVFIYILFIWQWHFRSPWLTSNIHKASCMLSTGESTIVNLCSITNDSLLFDPLAVSYKSGRGWEGGGVWIFSGTTNSARGYFLYNSFLLLVVFTLRLYFVTF